MKLAILALLISSISQAEYVQGHYTQSGTYVQGYYRSEADSNPYNNYSARGNTNPYTGSQGTVNPYSQPTYGQGNTGFSNYNSRRGW